MKINAKNFGLAGGILWGLAMFILTLIGMNSSYAMELLRLLEGAYPGYSVSGMGSIIGLIYGFLDAFIGLYIFAWIYNKLEGKK